MKPKTPTAGPARLIRRTGLSLRTLAKAAGVSADTLSRSVRNDTWPKQARVLAALKVALGVKS